MVNYFYCISNKFVVLIGILFLLIIFSPSIVGTKSLNDVGGSLSVIDTTKLIIIQSISGVADIKYNKKNLNNLLHYQ